MRESRCEDALWPLGLNTGLKAPSLGSWSGPKARCVELWYPQMLLAQITAYAIVHNTATA